MDRGVDAPGSGGAGRGPRRVLRPRYLAGGGAGVSGDGRRADPGPDPIRALSAHPRAAGRLARVTHEPPWQTATEARSHFPGVISRTRDRDTPAAATVSSISPVSRRRAIAGLSSRLI